MPGAITFRTCLRLYVSRGYHNDGVDKVEHREPHNSRDILLVHGSCWFVMVCLLFHDRADGCFTGMISLQKMTVVVRGVSVLCWRARRDRKSLLSSYPHFGCIFPLGFRGTHYYNEEDIRRCTLTEIAPLCTESVVNIRSRSYPSCLRVTVVAAQQGEHNGEPTQHPAGGRLALSNPSFPLMINKCISCFIHALN